MDSNEELIEFDSYIVPTSDLELGSLRFLEVDNRVIIPELTHTRFVITSGDVIHSFACPSLGIKCDAYPGRSGIENPVILICLVVGENNLIFPILNRQIAGKP